VSADLTDHEAGGAIPAGPVPVPRAPSSTGMMGRTFAALRHPNYRLYFTGQLISLIGTWMQNVAQGWLVYQLTGSPFYLGLVGFMASIPVLFLSLGAGVLIDRVPRRAVLMATQTTAMTLALVLSVLVFTNVVQPWHILVLSFLLGVSQAFDGTARQTFVKDMVGKEDMMNAIALNSALFNMSRIIGPALAGITLAAVGPAWCFLLNGLSFLAVIFGIWRMELPKFVPPARAVAMVAEIKEGLRYIRDNETIRTLMLLISISAIFGFAYNTLLPAYAQDVLHVDAQGLGFLSTASGLGALAGALIMASFGQSIRKGVLLTAGSLIFPVMLILLAFNGTFLGALPLLIASSFGAMIQNTTANTLVQTNVPDHLRGRVMSVYMLTFFGFSPLGALQAGVIAEHFGVPIGIATGAAIALAFGMLILWRAPRVRRLA
jgi:MFS family permease